MVKNGQFYVKTAENSWNDFFWMKSRAGNQNSVMMFENESKSSKMDVNACYLLRNTIRGSKRVLGVEIDRVRMGMVVLMTKYRFVVEIKW